MGVRILLSLWQDSNQHSMSWTWRGFWRDDPVFRFKNESFFQSGRHKAEERFWVNYIHNDGSYTKQTRARQPPEPSSSCNKPDDKDENIKQESSLIKHAVGEDSDSEVIETKEDAKSENGNKTEDINDNKHIDTGKGVIKRESEEKYETESTMTCLSCTKCSQPLGWVEKERYVSRMM